MLARCRKRLLVFVASMLLVGISSIPTASAYTGPVDAPLNYDFGSGAVKTGFTAVQNNTAYSATTHYGWTGTQPGCQRDRGGSDPLRTDFVCDETGALRTFAVDVPNGRYRVTGFIGDDVAAQVPMDVLAEGAEVVHGKTTTGAGDFTSVDFYVNVSDGQLSIGFRGTSSGNTWRINTLMVQPDVLDATDEFTDGSTLSTIPGVVKTIVWVPQSAADWTYSHNAAIVETGGTMIVGWWNGKTDGFDNQMRAAYVYSTDNGATWSSLGVIAADPDGTGLGARIFDGFWTRGTDVYALVEHFTKDAQSPTGRSNQSEHVYKWDNTTKTFTDQGAMISDFIPHGGPYQLSNGTYIFHGTNAAYQKQTLVGGSTSLTSFTRVVEPTPGDDHKMGESSSYQLDSGVIYQYYRDRSGGHKLYRSRSFDNGLTWEAPVPTNYTDATSKQRAGRSGNYFLINNADITTTRVRLMLSTSSDGLTFSKPRIIDYDATPPEFPGQKEGTGVQYPFGGRINGHMYVVADIATEKVVVYKVD